MAADQVPDDAVTTLLQDLTDVRLAEASHLGIRVTRSNEEAAALALEVFRAWLLSDQVRDMVATWLMPLWDNPKAGDILGLLAAAAEAGSDVD